MYCSDCVLITSQSVFKRHKSNQACGNLKPVGRWGQSFIFDTKFLRRLMRGNGYVKKWVTPPANVLACQSFSERASGLTVRRMDVDKGYSFTQNRNGPRNPDRPSAVVPTVAVSCSSSFESWDFSAELSTNADNPPALSDREIPAFLKRKWVWGSRCLLIWKVMLLCKSSTLWPLKGAEVA
jgi:hypothetical protein